MRTRRHKDDVYLIVERSTVAIRKVGSVIVIVSVAGAGALIFPACGQGSDESSSTLTSSRRLLQTVLGCQSAGQTCVAAAMSVMDVTQCNQQLRDCLLSLLPEGGLAGPPFPTLPTFDAAPPMFTLPIPLFDGGLRLPPPLAFPFLDGGFTLPPLPAFPDGGFTLPPPPPFPDGGFMLPTPPAPPAFPDAGLPAPPGASGGTPPQIACTTDLQQCLAAQTSPTTCANNASTCLSAALKAQCDAQEQTCLDAGVPQAACSAQRQACGP